MSVAAAGIGRDAPSSDQLLYNHTWCHPHLYISTFLGCVCSVPFSCVVCSGISIQSMCLMHHLLDTHLGFVVACGVQIAGAVTTATICEWMGPGSVRLWVLMVDGCVPHFEFASFPRTLFLASVFAFTFVM